MKKLYQPMSGLGRGLCHLLAIALLATTFLPCDSRADVPTAGERTQMKKRLATMRENVSTASITVFPIAVGQEPIKDVGAAVALFLEKANMKEIDLAKEAFRPSAAHDVWQICDLFSAFTRKQGLDTDYALFGQYVVAPEAGFKEVRGIIVDKEGNAVWVDRQTPEDEDFKRVKAECPMTCSYLLVERLRTPLGLPDPTREDAPEGKWAAYFAKRAGVPPDSELAAMKERLPVWRKNFKSSKLAVFPVMVNENASEENAVNLANLLDEAELCLAEVASIDTVFELDTSAGQLRMLWDLARKVRSYVKAKKVKGDYTLYAQYATGCNRKGDEFVGLVHFVLCDRDGEWVIVDLQNEHHPDFQNISPKTASDGDKLVLKRLKGYLTPRKIIGVGIFMNQDAAGNFVITRVVEQGPADEAGLKPQDRIIGIDGEKVEGWTMNELGSKIKGEKGTEVEFRVMRGDKTLDVTVVRREVTFD